MSAKYKKTWITPFRPSQMALKLIKKANSVVDNLSDL